MSALCSDPTQCTAYHELSAHMAEMNTKLTSVLSLLQMFFHSWKASDMRLAKDVESLAKSLSSFTRIEHQKRFHSSMPSMGEPKPKRVPYSLIMSTSSSSGTFWPGTPADSGHLATVEALPVEQSVPVSSEEATAAATAIVEEVVESATAGAVRETGDIVHGIKAEIEEEEVEEDVGEEPERMNGVEGAENPPEASTSSISDSTFSPGYKPATYTSVRRFRVQTRTFPQSAEELRKHVLLFPGHIVTPRAMSRVGSLAYFRKKKMLTYDELKLNIQALRQEKILTQEGYRLPYFKVAPENLSAENRAALDGYGVTIEEYTDAYNSPPYNLSEKRKPETPTMVVGFQNLDSKSAAAQFLGSFVGLGNVAAQRVPMSSPTSFFTG